MAVGVFPSGVAGTGQVGVVTPWVKKPIFGVAGVGQIGTVLIGGWTGVNTGVLISWTNTPTNQNPVWTEVATNAATTVWEEVTM